MIERDRVCFNESELSVRILCKTLDVWMIIWNRSYHVQTADAVVISKGTFEYYHLLFSASSEVHEPAN